MFLLDLMGGSWIMQLVIVTGTWELFQKDTARFLLQVLYF